MSRGRSGAQSGGDIPTGLRRARPRPPRSAQALSQAREGRKVTESQCALLVETCRMGFIAFLSPHWWQPHPERAYQGVRWPDTSSLTKGSSQLGYDGWVALCYNLTSSICFLKGLQLLHIVPHVYHYHSTWKVRSLLSGHCGQALLTPINT